MSRTIWLASSPSAWRSRWISGRVTLPSRRSLRDRLADGIRVSREVEQVVDDLERDAEVEAVLAEGALAVRADRAEHAADLRAPAEQVRRLASMMSKCSSSVMSASPFLVSWYSSPSIM